MFFGQDFKFSMAQPGLLKLIHSEKLAKIGHPQVSGDWSHFDEKM